MKWNFASLKLAAIFWQGEQFQAHTLVLILLQFDFASHKSLKTIHLYSTPSSYSCKYHESCNTVQYLIFRNCISEYVALNLIIFHYSIQLIQLIQVQLLIQQQLV